VIRRSWNADPGAPRLERATVVTEVRRHPAVASWLAARVDPSVATGSLLTVAVAMFVIGAGGVGVLLLMIRAHSGFALFDLGAAKWAARHATPFSTYGLRVL